MVKKYKFGQEVYYDRRTVKKINPYILGIGPQGEGKSETKWIKFEKEINEYPILFGVLFDDNSFYYLTGHFTQNSIDELCEATQKTKENVRGFVRYREFGPH